MTNLIFFVLGVFVGGTKRSLEVSDDSWFISVSDHAPEEWARVVNDLAGRTGDPLDALRSGVLSGIHREILSLSQLEVEVFEYIVTNPDTELENLLTTINENIPTDRFIDGKPLTMPRVAIWRNYITSMVEKNSESHLESFVREHTRIVTQNSTGIVFLELSDFAFDIIVLEQLFFLVPRPLVNALFPAKPTIPRDPQEFQTLLVDQALRFVHQNLLTGATPEDFARALVYFDTTSILANRMAEYFMSIWIKCFIEPEVATMVRQMSPGTDQGIILNTINSMFEGKNHPAYNMLYTWDRISWLIADPPRQPPTPESIINSLRMSTSLSELVTAEEVKLSWENRERVQATGTRFVISPSTMIAGLKFKPNFQLPLGSDANGTCPICSLADSARTSILAFLRRPDVDLDDHAEIEYLSTETGVSVENINQIITYMKSLRTIPLEIARELARVNKKKINTDISSILRKIKRIGVDTTNVDSRHVFVFYKMMLIKMFESGNDQYAKIFLITDEIFATIENGIWKKYLASLSVSDLCP